MYLSGFKDDPYLMIEPDSNLENIPRDFLEGKYRVRLDGDFSEEFLEDFKDKFRNITNLNLSTCFNYQAKKSFVFQLDNLDVLSISLWRDNDFVLDCTTLPPSLTTLWFTVWSKKQIININSLNSHLISLSISDFDEKDLSLLNNLSNLKSLYFATARCRSLKGIENLKNLKVLTLGGMRSLADISDLICLQQLKFLEFDICWKLTDFSCISALKELEVLRIMDCKNLASIKFVEKMPKLRQLFTLGTTVINDFDTTPAKNVPVFFGSMYSKYNVQYPEKEIKEGLKTEGSYL